MTDLSWKERAEKAEAERDAAVEALRQISEFRHDMPFHRQAADMRDIARAVLRAESAGAQASLFDAIAHGDADHRRWLKDAIAAHFSGRPVPAPYGLGRTEAELKALRERIAEGEAAEREACARVLDRRVQSLQAALTGEPNDINARLHACIHNLRQCAAAIRARSAPREGEG